MTTSVDQTSTKISSNPTPDVISDTAKVVEGEDLEEWPSPVMSHKDTPSKAIVTTAPKREFS